MFDLPFQWPFWLKSLRPPSICHICEAWPSSAICESCVAQFAQPIPRCPTCALPLIKSTCSVCYDEPPPLDQCIAAVTYGYPWAECIAQYKFNGDVGLGRQLAYLMRHTPWSEPALEAADSVIAIPLSAYRLRERGFNQSHELAKYLAPKKTDIHVLRRLEHRSHQVGASRAERLAQTQNTFWIEPRQISCLQGKKLVLVDDVMTTGATLFEAARVLRKAGAVHITGLVFARAELTQP
jgi:ComF family protein